MNGKLYIASILTFVLIGCGGTSSGKCCTGGIKPGDTAKSVITNIVADKDGKTNISGDIVDSDGNPVGNIAINRTSNILGGVDEPACQSGGCNVTVIQESYCPRNPIANPVLRYAKCYGNAALDYANNHRDILDYNPETQMIVYGGAILLQSSDFDKIDATLNVKGIDCGMEVRTEKPEGFSNKGHKVFALVKILDACGNDVDDSHWTKEVTMDENGNFTLELDGLEFGDDNQIEILLFSIKDATVSGSTGSGGSGV